jgi:hypothetical protein
VEAGLSSHSHHRITERSQAACSRTRARPVAVLLLLILAALLSLPGGSSIVLAQSPITVREQSAKPDFPNEVVFKLRASGFEAERAELNYSLVGEPVTAGVQADVKSPTSDIDSSVTLDLAVYYIPPGSEVSYYWTLTSPDGEIAETPTKTFRMFDDDFPWKTLSDPQGRVSVHWYEGDNDFGKDLLSTATGALDRLQQDVGAGLDRPADVWVYATQDDLLSALPQNLPEWVGGKAFPGLALVLATIADDEYASLETKRVIPHELSHLVLYQATRNPYNSPPAWLDEGLAVHNQEAHDPAEEEALQAAAEEDRLPPVKALSGSFGADEEAAILSYAQSRSVVDFVLDDPRYGPAKLARTVDAFKEGVTYDDALQAGLGITVDELDKEWRASLPYKIGSRPAAPRSDGRTTITLSWLNPVLLVGLGLIAGLFVAGALLTAIVIVRRRRSTQPTQPPTPPPNPNS